MTKKYQNKICIKCGKIATIYGSGFPTCCNGCYDKIKAWQAVNLYLPHQFKVTLKEWEHTSVMDALKTKYERKSIDEIEITVSNYGELVETVGIAIANKSEVIKFKEYILSVKETTRYIEQCETMLTEEKG